MDIRAFRVAGLGQVRVRVNLHCAVMWRERPIPTVWVEGVSYGFLNASYFIVKIALPLEL